MSELKPRRLTPEESINAFHEGKRQSDERRQQTAKMSLSPVGLEVEIAQLRLQLEAANKVALAAMDRAKGLQAEVDRMAPEFEAILAVNDGLRAEVAAKDAAYLGGAPTEAEALQMRLDAAEAEVAAWRRAVRWEQVTDHLGVSVDEVWQLRLCNGHPSKLLGYAILTDRGWRASNQHQSVCKLPDRNTACAKVCELRGIPAVLPVGGE